MAQALDTATGYLQMGGMLAMFFGDAAFQKMGMATPQFYTQMMENKMMTFFGMMMVRNVVHGFSATNAFEVSYKGKLLHSKLKSGNFPNIESLCRKLESRGLKRMPHSDNQKRNLHHN